MAKKQQSEQAQYVRKETFYMVTLLALAVGFFGGVVFAIFKSDSRAPAASAPAQMGTPAPTPAGSDRIAALERQVLAIIADRKAKQIPITWQFSIQSARSKLNSHYVKLHPENSKFKKT